MANRILSRSARALIAVSVLALSFASAPSLAQSNPEVSEDVVYVTAQRREQSTQDVSIALSVFDGETLSDLGVATVNDLESYVPSLEVESQFGSGQPSFSIRGVGFRDYASNNAPTVGIYVDDVAYTLPVMTQGVLFDVERVEVLRGPQGTLYGRNTTGGAIKVISAKPTEELSYGGEVSFDQFGEVDAQGHISGPLSDTVRARLSLASTQGGAWQINRETGEELGDADQFAIRGVLDADISDTLTASINLHAYQDQSDGTGLYLFNDSVFGAAAHWGRRQTSWGSSDEFADLIGIESDTAPFRDNEGFGASVKLNAAMDGFTLNYIGAYESLDRREFNDYDALTLGGAGVYFETDAEVISHELRAVSGDSAAFRWVAGLFYGEEELDELYQSDFVASFGPGFAVSTPYDQEVTTLAVYAHGEFDLSERATLIAGLRFENEERALRNLGTFAVGFGTFNFANGTVDGTLENRDLDSDNVSGKLGLDYRVSDDLLTYASFSRGIKSGGFTAYNTLNPNALEPFQPEELNAFELGFKSGSGALTLNGAVFFYDYENQQVQSAIYDSGTGAVVGRIVNASESEIFGAELELVYQLNDWLTLGQSLGFKDGEFKVFTDLDIAASSATGTAVYIDRSGQDLGFPNVSYQGFVAAETALNADWNLFARLDYAYRDELSLPLLGADYAVDDYWLTNGLIELSPSQGNWSVALWGRNLFNTEYDETRNFFIGSGGLADIAAPGKVGTYGIRLAFQR
jgi:outer membrane receptor protein involved in Fe transport